MKTMLSALKILATAALTPLLTLVAASAHAQETAEKMVGNAKPWQLNFQEPATPVMEQLVNTHNILLYLITGICVFVLVAMMYICVRFRRKANPIASKTTHNTTVEIVWTTIPILILIAIAIPSLRLHYFMQKTEEAQMTLKVVGYQWYWHYDYPDQGGFGFDSYMKKDADLKEGEPRLLAVDNRVVVPVDTTVRVLVTGADVIHSWAMPAFGVKRDAMPGRLNETWFKAEKLGTYYGQCSELCGVGHGFMPIVVDVVTQEEFAKWAAAKREEAGIVLDSGKPATTKTDPKMAAPLAKPESAAEDKTPAARMDEQKERSRKTGEGKPSTSAPSVTPPEKSTQCTIASIERASCHAQRSCST
ncbi:MAG: cytochrome c oxidase subunit II, partial [Rickettsiales bacterium]|nr:cytochrome c oxidase subunit II [Rickettsiales bacterium]